MKALLKSVLVALCRRLGQVVPVVYDFSSLADGKQAALLLDTMRTARFLNPLEVNVPESKKVLVIAPHPDDEVIGLGGAIAMMVDRGCEVEVAILTSGADIQAHEEAKNAASLLGYSVTAFYDVAPSNLLASPGFVEKFAEFLIKTKPEVLFIPFMLDDHKDHIESNRVLFEALRGKRYEYSDVSDVWAYQVYSMIPLNAVLNITGVVERKDSAIRCYNSRFSQRDWAHFARGKSAFGARFLAGSKGPDHVELFLKTSMKQYLMMCELYFGSGHFKGNQESGESRS